VIQVGTPQQVYAQPINVAAARLTGPVSLLAGSDVLVLVRPDWAKLGGDRTGIVADVWFRGSHTDYLLDTPDGQLQLRAAGLPAHGRGEEVSWSLHHSWTLPGD
jgi:iron(III) transport system ATP-binding protein